MTTRMVRRRGRARKLNETPDNMDAIHQNIEAGAVGIHNSNLLDDKFFCSPKRKDCKIENDENNLKQKEAANKISISKETVGKKNGVLLTSRSQTKTIDNFFKTDKPKTDSQPKCISPVPNEPPNALTNGKHSPDICEPIDNIAADIFDNSDVGSDDSSTDSSVVCHRQEPAHIEDSDSGVNSLGAAPFCCPVRSSTENIFLQEPVLSLNVDKSPNQASSIKINKSLEIEPTFSSPPNGLTVPCPNSLNGRFSTVVSLNKSPSKKDSINCETKSDSLLLNMYNNDSSCDSGVALSSMDNNNTTTNITQKRKPATPHRIVCPSPVKSVTATSERNIIVSGTNKNIKSPSRKTSTQYPRKQQMKKSRRKLNQELLKTKEMNSHNTNGHLNVEDNVEHEQDEHEIENLSDETILKSQLPITNKLVLNSAINPTAKQNSKNNYCTNGTEIKLNSHIVRKVVAAGVQSKLKQSQKTLVNRDIGEFFQVRRSVRKTKTAVKEEMMRDLEKAIIEERSEGLKIAHFDDKGRGIIADRRFFRGEFVVEYVGDLIDMIEASEREKRYALDENAGCYMYYFKHKNQQYCIDATVDSGKLGRLVNHSRNGNLITKVVVVKTRPHLILLAKDDIEPGEELTYDYGDRSKEALLHHPWLAF